MPVDINIVPPDMGKIPAPLVLGVTGHRDLRREDLDRLREEVRKILRQLRKDYSFTPLVLLSPLAEGADRLVARVALEPEIHARLVVPMPMLRRLYEQDFGSPESLAEFRELLDRAEYSFEMPMLATEDQVGHASAERDRQYEAVGKYIARESQIVLALWDGKRSDKVGGTAQIVKFQLEGVQSGGEFSLQPPEAFPVYHIPTPRLSNPHLETQPFRTIPKYPKGFKDSSKAQTYYATIFHNLDGFNQCIVQGGNSLIENARQSKSDLLKSDPPLNFDQANLSPPEILDLDRYAAADALTRGFQSKMLRMNSALHWLVFAAFLCLVVFAHHQAHHFLWLFFSLLVLGAAYLWHSRGGGMKLDARSQDYRAIAEGWRIRFFWHLAGIHESVADHYLGRQRTELDWIRNGLRGWSIGPADLDDPQRPLLDRLKSVRKLWIDAQIQYFHRAIGKNEEKLKKVEMLVQICIWLVVLIGLGMLFAALLIECGCWTPKDKEWIVWPVIALDFFLGAGALLHHASQQRAYAADVKRFQRTETIFSRAAQAFDENLQANDIHAVQRLLTDLGREALLENGDWVLLHRERPLELPHP